MTNTSHSMSRYLLSPTPPPFCRFNLITFSFYLFEANLSISVSFFKIPLTVFCSWLHLYGSWEISKHPLEKCKFNKPLHPLVWFRFRILYHSFVFVMLQSHAPGTKRIKLDTPEDIAKWREERRKWVFPFFLRCGYCRGKASPPSAKVGYLVFAGTTQHFRTSKRRGKWWSCERRLELCWKQHSLGKCGSHFLYFIFYFMCFSFFDPWCPGCRKKRL